MAQAQVGRLTKDLLRRHRRGLSILLVLTIIGFLSMSVGHWLFGEAVAEVQAQLGLDISAFESLIFSWMAIIISFSALRGLYLYGMACVRINTIQKILHDLRERLFDRVQAMELDWHHKHGAGELVTRTTRDCDMVRNATDSSFQLVEICTMLFGSIVLLFIYNWLLAIVPASLVCLAMFIYYRQAKVMVELNRKTDDAYDHVTQELTEGVEGVRVVKAFGLEAKRLARFSGFVNEFISHGLRAVKYATTRIPLPQLMVSLAHPWVLVLGIMLIQQGAGQTFSDDAFTVGQLLAALMAMTTLIFRLDGIGAAMRMIAEAIASLQRLSEVIYAEEQIHDAEHVLAPGPLSLEVSGIQVKDEEGHIILRDSSFTVNSGEIVALIGATGSGKSILCSLLPRLKDAQVGSVRVIDSQGADYHVQDCKLSELRRRVQVVPQESFLFSDSIAGNLRIGKADASEEEMWQALTYAGIDEFIRGLDQQLSTKVGERGMNLSGGQKQRLCLARAIIGQPDVLILDDSTSALDAITEERIFDLMRNQERSTAILLVTTRLSSVLLADRVLLLDDGAILEQGTHADLAKESRRYRDLLCLEQQVSELDHE